MTPWSQAAVRALLDDAPFHWTHNKRPASIAHLTVEQPPQTAAPMPATPRSTLRQMARPVTPFQLAQPCQA